jgi:TonB-linked SusC/RagA family outer membrane protein
MKIDLAKVQGLLFPKTNDPSQTSSERTLKQAIKLLLMRIYLLACCVFILASNVCAAAAHGQARITLHEKDAPLLKVLKTIRSQSGYDFAGQNLSMTSGSPVSISIEDASVQEALDLIFKNQPFTYEIVDRIIVIKPRQNAEPTGPGEPGKIVHVTGTVTTEANVPLASATVTLLPGGRVTTTNAKGEFDMGNIPVGSTLLVSFVGYAPQQIKIKDEANLKIYMAISRKELDQAVIQGYGTTTQRLNTGNIGIVTAEQIERQPVMNPLLSIEGQVPGVVVTPTNGYASAPIRVEIRGRTGINGGLTQDPLYVIDGVPMGVLNLGNGGNYASGSTGFLQNGFTGPAEGQSPLFSVNPNDIESISVLKDADATAIYGSRGANGVILITTKRGHPGKTKLEVNAYQGVSIVTARYNLMNTSQYLAMRREAFKNDGIAPNLGNAYDLLLWDTTRYTNWQNALWGGTGENSDVSATLSGGDKQTTFRVSGTYHRQTSILTKSGADQRASVQFNITHKSLDERLTLSFTSMYSYAGSNMVSIPGAPLLPPDAPAIFNSEGNLNWAGWGITNSTQRDLFPFSVLLQPYNSNTGFLNSHLSLQYELAKGLTLSTSLGYSTTHVAQLQKIPIKSQDPALNPYGSASFGNNNQNNDIVEPQLEYVHSISKGKLDAMAGGSLQSLNEDGNTIYGSGYTNDNLLGSIGNAGQKNAYNGSGAYKYAAAFGRINYNWESKYILNLSGRRDGSSRFGPGKQYGNFGSAGAAWIFTEENFLKKASPILSFGKLRASYGSTGDDDIGDYQYLSQWSANGVVPYTINGPAAYTPLSLFNTNLQWQVNKKLEEAIDLGFFGDALTLEVAHYQNRCGNQLVEYPLATITGFSDVSANLPALVQNEGWEGLIRYKFIDSKNTTWSVSANVSHNDNKLIKFPGLSESPYASLYTVGKSLNIRRMLKVTGVDPLTGQYTFADKNHNGTVDYQYNNGQNDLYDYNTNVLVEGGFGTEFRYKGLQLNVFFHFRHQPYLLSAINTAYAGNLGTSSNQSTFLIDKHWQKPGDHALFARYTTEGANSDFYYQDYSDGPYSNGSFLRLKNVALNYSVPMSNRLFRHSAVQGINIFARAENVFLITKYLGVDPESPGFGLLPPQRTFVGGIKFNL